MSLDTFYLRCAVTLGVTQKQFEDEFYLIDVFEYMTTLKQKESSQLLMSLNIRMANRLDSKEYEKFVKGLMYQAGYKEETKFNRGKLEELRSMISG